jgi:hypothetical protein
MVQLVLFYKAALSIKTFSKASIYHGYELTNVNIFDYQSNEKLSDILGVFCISFSSNAETVSKK